MSAPGIRESAINIVAEDARIEGKAVFTDITRVHGTIVGEVHARDGSTLILGETALVEAIIRADQVIIDGFVRGDIIARGRVVVTRTGRVVGNIRTPSLKLEFGAYFEGRCSMEEGAAPAPTSDRAPSPA